MNTLLQMFKDPKIESYYKKPEVLELTKHLIRYLFKLIPLAQFKKELDYYGLRTEEWRSNANESSNVARVKLWIRYVCVYPEKNSAKRFGLTNKDDRQIKDLLLEDPQLLKEVAEIPGPTLTWARMQEVMAKALFDLSTFAKNRSIQKLRFLRTDSGNDIEDFQSELLIYVVAGVYAKYPRFDSYKHLLNTGRTIINNRSINIIKHHTSQGRACKFQNADGTFGSNKVSLDALTENRASGETLLGEDLTTNTALDQLEVQQSITALVSSPKKVEVVKLLMGHDEGFSEWLVQNKKTSLADNAKYQERLISEGNNKEYLKHISDYLNIPFRKLQAFLKALTIGLGADRLSVA